MEYEGVINPGVFAGPNFSPANYRGGPDGTWFMGNNGFSYKFTYQSNSDARLAFENCAPLAAVILKKAKSYINGNTCIVNTQGKAKGKEANGTDATKIRNLLARPNPIQSWKQFEAQQEIYVDLFGFCILLPIYAFGYDQDPVNAQSIWNIPPNMVDIKETNKLFYQTDVSGIIEKVVLNYKNQKTLLDVSKLWIFKDFTPNFDSLIFPESRLCSLEIQINNIIAAYESRNVLISRRGAMGILSNGSKDVLGNIMIDQDEKDELQRGFSSYGLRRDQWQVIVTNAALQWQQMGYPTKDLMLFEEIEDDVQRICDVYEYPYRLLSSKDTNSLGGTDANIFLKNLYQDSIIPTAGNLYEQWNLFFNTAGRGIEVTKDFSHIPVLQEDKVNEGRARLYDAQAYQIMFTNDLITRNTWLTQMGLDPINDATGDLYYSQLVAQGIIQPIAPKPPATGSGNPADA